MWAWRVGKNTPDTGNSIWKFPMVESRMASVGELKAEHAQGSSQSLGHVLQEKLEATDSKLCWLLKKFWSSFAMDWMLSPQNVYVEALIPNVVMFGGGALVLDELIRVGPWWRVSCPYKKKHKRACFSCPFLPLFPLPLPSWSYFCHVKTQGRDSHLQAKKRPHQTLTILPVSRTMRQ